MFNKILNPRGQLKKIDFFSKCLTLFKQERQYNVKTNFTNSKRQYLRKFYSLIKNKYLSFKFRGLKRQAPFQKRNIEILK